MPSAGFEPAIPEIKRQHSTAMAPYYISDFGAYVNVGQSATYLCLTGCLICFSSAVTASLMSLVRAVDVSFSSNVKNEGVVVGGLVPAPPVPEVQLLLPVKKASRITICCSRSRHVSLNSVEWHPQSGTTSENTSEHSG
jgi:hypothetical protein